MRIPLLVTKIAAVPILFGGTPAAAQWIDAGNQAMIMHQGQLLEQQTAPDQRDRSATPQCASPQTKAQLRAEYDRRVRAQGKAKADAWLRVAAAEAGRQAGLRAKKGTAC